MDLDNLFRAIVYYLIIGGMVSLSHQNEVSMGVY